VENRPSGTGPDKTSKKEKKMKRFKIMAMAAALAALCFTPASADIYDDVLIQVGGQVYVWGADDTYANAPQVRDVFLVDPASPGTQATDLNPGLEGTPLITGTLNPITDPTTVTADMGLMMSVISSPSGAGPFFTDTDSDGYLSIVDSFTPFLIDDTTDVILAAATMSHSFYVASNCVFDIYAWSNLMANTGTFGSTLTLADISYAIAVDGGSGSITDGVTTINWGANSQDPSGGGGAVNPGAFTDLDDFSAGFAKVMDGGQLTAASDGTIATQSAQITNTYGLSTAYDLSMGTGQIWAQVIYTIYNP
jgi:hypothetical protein